MLLVFPLLLQFLYNYNAAEVLYQSVILDVILTSLLDVQYFTHTHSAFFLISSNFFLHLNRTFRVFALIILLSVNCAAALKILESWNRIFTAVHFTAAEIVYTEKYSNCRNKKNDIHILKIYRKQHTNLHYFFITSKHKLKKVNYTKKTKTLYIVKKFADLQFY